MSEDTTTIQISIENYKRLNGMKNPGDSFDDVIGRVLDEHKVFRERLNHSAQDAVTTNEPETPVRQSQGSDISTGIEDTSGENGSNPEPPNESENSRQMALSSTNRLEDNLNRQFLDSTSQRVRLGRNGFRPFEGRTST